MEELDTEILPINNVFLFTWCIYQVGHLEDVVDIGIDKNVAIIMVHRWSIQHQK